MKRFALAVPVQRCLPAVLAVALGVACSDSTGPDRTPPQGAGPSFQLEEPPRENATCVGVLTGRFQNVVVPEGATCVIYESDLSGNLKALPGSQLLSVDNTVAGSIQAEKTRMASVHLGSVQGSIEIVDGPGGGVILVPDEVIELLGFCPLPCQVRISGYVVRSVEVTRGIHVIKNHGVVVVELNVLPTGNIKVEDNSVPPIFSGSSSLVVYSNNVAGNLQVFKNRGEGALKDVSDNTAQVVQCQDNDEPFFGGPNLAKSEGQCFGAPAQAP